jgi:hypothetical protein
VAHGHDPANQKTAERGAAHGDRTGKRKAGTADYYRDILDRIVKPALGTTKADKLSRQQVGRLHWSPAPVRARWRTARFYSLTNVKSV